MADRNLSGIAPSVDNENGDSQPPTPDAAAKATDGGRYLEFLAFFECEWKSVKVLGSG
jgi:hypothetical protein